MRGQLGDSQPRVMPEQFEFWAATLIASRMRRRRQKPAREMRAKTHAQSPVLDRF